MDTSGNGCSLCYERGDLFQLSGYSFLTCGKCSEGLVKGIMPFYQSKPTTSTVPIDQPQKKAPTMHIKLEMQQPVQHLQPEVLMSEPEGACPVCNKVFTRKSSLLNHIRNHSADKKYLCSYCQKGFSQAANLRNHVRIHTNERPFVCFDCGKAFTQITNHSNHRRLHTGERPYVCIETSCGRSFAQVTNLNNHLKTHHKIQQYICNQCHKKFSSITQLNNHLINSHGEHKLLFCPHCPDKSFKQQSHLMQHMKIHGTQFGFSCTKCDEKFITANHLESHMKQHGQHACNLCSASFNDDALLKKHIQKHIEGRFTTCDMIGCNVSVTTKNQMNKHMQLHHPTEYKAQKEARQVPISLVPASNQQVIRQTKVARVKSEPVDQDHHQSPQIPITIAGPDGQSYQLNIPANYHQFGQLQNLNVDQTEATNDVTKKVLSIPQILINARANELDRFNQFNTFLSAFHGSSSPDPAHHQGPIVTSPKLACTFCYNVFKTDQTLARHITKFHS